MNTGAPKDDHVARAWSLALVVAIVLAKLWLVAAQRVSAIGPAGYDDGLFVGQAHTLVSGRWLGSYGPLTLAKGPWYPIWIALSFALGVPLQFGEHVLYVAASGVLVVALAPAVRSRAVRVLLFGLLAFSPASYADGPMTRVVREAVYPSLTLLVLGASAGMLLRADREPRVLRGWAVASGAALACYWLCREERVWLAPALAVLVVLTVPAWRARWRPALRAGLVATGVFATIVGAVEVKNLTRYGVVAVTEFTDGPFPSAYAALARARHDRFRPRVPLPAATRAQLYDVSPSFAELRPFLEGDLGRTWLRVSCERAGLCDEIGGGWMMWALRDASERAGHARSARDAARFWRNVRDEVNRGCAAKQIACEPTPLGFLPQMRREYFEIFRTSLLQATVALISFDGLSPYPGPSFGDDEDLRRFRDLVRSPLAPVAGAAVQRLPHQDGLDAHKLAILAVVAACYRSVMPLATALALIAGVLAAGIAFARRRLAPALAVALALLVAIATRVAMLALVDATSFPAVNSLYLAPAYPLLLALVFAAGVALFVTIRERPGEVPAAAAPTRNALDRTGGSKRELA